MQRTWASQTPLPKLQIGIILLLQVCEPLTSSSIYPYINTLVGELGVTGGDARKVGYYAGLIESIFFAAEALTVLHWGRASDHIGRKPILLIGLIGTAISMLSFGLSRTFWALVISRSLTGFLNGNIGVMKSVMGELTDPTNRVEGFAYVPVVEGFGATVGPFIGGTLSHPHERFSSHFAGTFWRTYPYFLPCLITSGYVLSAFILTLSLFKETVPKQQTSESSYERGPHIPLRDLIRYPNIILSISNYVVLAFLHIAAAVLLPLFLSMPLEIGGLNLDPPTIGFIIGFYGVGTTIFQALFFSRIISYFGEKKSFVAAIAAFIPMFMSFPMINIFARQFGQRSLPVFLSTTFLLALLALLDIGYGTIFIYITAASPNQRSLGATNGLSQSTVSFARAIGPALSTSLFSFSVEQNILNGFGVYALFTVLSIFGLYLSTRLPEQVWQEAELSGYYKLERARSHSD